MARRPDIAAQTLDIKTLETVTLETETLETDARDRDARDPGPRRCWALASTYLPTSVITDFSFLQS